jgi:tetratricopeptide (TPR) repeat protein
MEFPPFRAYDNFMARHALTQEPVLRQLLNDHRIDFIATYVRDRTFKDVIEKFTDFVPVFFDDAHVLYANKALQPAIAGGFRLQHVDPFNLTRGEGTAEERLEEMRRVAAVHPEGRRVLHGLAWLLFSEKRYEESLEYSRELAEHHPLNANGPYMIGNNLENLERCGEASEHYRAALDIAGPDFHTILYKHLGTCAYLTKEFEVAYDYFSKGINPYLRIEAAEDLYQYAFSAAVTGETEHAVRLLDILLVSLGEDNEEIREDAQALQARIQAQDFAELGLLSWLRSFLP